METEDPMPVLPPCWPSATEGVIYQSLKHMFYPFRLSLPHSLSFLVEGSHQSCLPLGRLSDESP